MSDIDKPIARILDTYKSAVLAKNVETFMHLYDPKVRVFDAWGVWSYEGAAAWRIAVEGWFTSLGSDKVKVTFDEVQIAGGAEMASLSAIVTYAALPASGEGQAHKTLHNRLSWVLRTSGHVMRIAHEHTSAPIGFEDMKAILQRVPAA
jgi:ketosteroid isomerase-like protein